MSLPTAEPNQSPLRWPLAVLTVSLGLILIALAHESVWDALGVLKLRPYFADTAALLAAGEAKQAGLDPYQPNPLDPLGRPHVYGPLWLVTGPLGLKVSDTWWVGAVLGLGFLIVASFVLWPRNLRESVFAILAICSPSVLLAVHRANNDIVVFLLLVGAAWLLSRPRWSAAWGGASLLGLAAVLKLYPVAAFPVVGMRKEGWRTVVVIGALVLGCGLAVYASWKEFQTAFALAPRPQTALAYGLNVAVLSWNVLQDRTMLVVGWVLGSALVVFAVGRRVPDIWRSVPDDSFTSLCFLAGACCWVFCYLANTNYGYRIILVLPAVSLLLRSAREGQVGRTLLELWLFTLWLPMPRRWMANRVAYADATAVPPWETLKVIVGLEQACVAWLTVTLMIAIAGAFARRMSEWRSAHE